MLVDFVLIYVRVYIVDLYWLWVQVVVVCDGWIVYVGDIVFVYVYVGVNMKVVDVVGWFVLLGFVELYWYFEMIVFVFQVFVNYEDLYQVFVVLCIYVELYFDELVIIGMGWVQVMILLVMLCKEIFDVVCVDCFVCLLLIDFYLMWVNLKVLEIVGIDVLMLFVQEGVSWFEKDVVMGELIGLIVDGVVYLLLLQWISVVGLLLIGIDLYLKLILLWQEKLCVVGVMIVFDVGFFDVSGDQLLLYEMLQMMECVGDLKLCVVGSVVVIGEIDDLVGMLVWYCEWYDLLFVKVCVLKLFFDGIEVNYIVYLLELYVDCFDICGVLMMLVDMFNCYLVDVDCVNVNVMVYCVGDVVVWMVFDGFDVVNCMNLLCDCCYVIMYVFFMYLDDILCFCCVGVMVNMQL